MMQTRWMRWGVAALAAMLPTMALAQQADPVRWQLNMGRGVTPTSVIAYEAHMWVLWACVVIGVIVFAAMGVAIFKFRKSQGAVADTSFTHSVKLEALWTIIPVFILIALAFPATSGLIKLYDTRDAEMTVKVTGYQWMWAYEYLGEGVGFTSRLDRRSEELRQSGQRVSLEDHPHYLLDVDNELVLPTNTKIKFVITADDVIHSWWVPALGWKQDAVPGFINENWAQIDEPGVYRGQCAELCGKDHGFMPIVVRALPRAEFDAWLAQRKAEREADAGVQPVAAEAPAQSDAVPPEAAAETLPVAG